MLSREKFLEVGKTLKSQLKREQVTLSTGTLYVREMLASERSLIDTSCTKEVIEKGKQAYKFDMKDFQAKFIVSCVCDDKGELLFEFDDYKWIGQSMTVADFSKLFAAAEKLNVPTEAEKNE